MDTDSHLISLTWKSHSLALINSLEDFLKKESYCDATVICEGKHLKVHKIILSTYSEYFKEIFDDILCFHPYIIVKDVALEDLEALLEYMYNGKTNISRNRFSQFINAADYFRVKGLAISGDVSSSIKISNIFSEKSGNCNTENKNNLKLYENPSKTIDNYEFEDEKEEYYNSLGLKRKSKKQLVPKAFKKSFINISSEVQNNDGLTKITENSHLLKRDNLHQDPITLLSQKDGNLCNFDISKRLKIIKGTMKEKNYIKLGETGNIDIESHLNNPAIFIPYNKNETHIGPSSSFSGLRENEAEIKEHSSQLLEKTFNLVQPLDKDPDRDDFKEREESEMEVSNDVEESSINKITDQEFCFRHLQDYVWRKPLKCRNCSFHSNININLKKHEENCYKRKEEDCVDNALSDSSSTKESLSEDIIKNNYFLCAFCPHKTTSKTLLACHVEENH